VAAGLAVWVAVRWASPVDSKPAVESTSMALTVPALRGDASAGRARSLSPAMAKEQEILSRHRDTVSDPDLAARFASVNDAHFGGGLPTVPVAWEPALQEVGPLIGEGFALEGLTNGRVILLNPQLLKQPAALQRALCHEMVHVYLFGQGGDRTSHGAEFQETLRRLSDEGAFEGIPATEREKVELRRALGVESARLDRENTELTSMRQQIDDDRRVLDEAVEKMNARIARANEQQDGWPTERERDALERSRNALNDLVADYNDRIGRQRAAVDAFNEEVQRYTLMAAYPDGLDAEVAIPPKSVAVSGSSSTAAR
jgi:hypothetical protein